VNEKLNDNREFVKTVVVYEGMGILIIFKFIIYFIYNLK